MDPPKVPQYQPAADDPQTLALKQRALDDQTAATQHTARIDSASLLARYGALVATANAGAATAPGTAAPALSSDAAMPGSGAGNSALATVLAATRGLLPQPQRVA